MKNYLILFSLISTSVVAESDVVHISDHGFIVKNQFVTAKSSEEVWQALINEVDNWWPKDHSWWGAEGSFSIAPEAGGCFCEVSGDKSAEHMHIAFVDPGKLLRMTGGLGPLQGMGMYGALDWQFETVEQGTQVTLTYSVSGINPDGFEQLAPIVAKVQGIQLNGLKEFVEKAE